MNKLDGYALKGRLASNKVYCLCEQDNPQKGNYGIFREFITPYWKDRMSVADRLGSLTRRESKPTSMAFDFQG